MVPIGFGVLFVGYGIFFQGWVLIKGYDVPSREIWSPLNWYSGDWPPPKAPANRLFPASK